MSPVRASTGCRRSTLTLYAPPHAASVESLARSAPARACPSLSVSHPPARARPPWPRRSRFHRHARPPVRTPAPVVSSSHAWPYLHALSCECVRTYRNPSRRAYVSERQRPARPAPSPSPSRPPAAPSRPNLPFCLSSRLADPAARPRLTLTKSADQCGRARTQRRHARCLPAHSAQAHPPPLASRGYLQITARGTNASRDRSRTDGRNTDGWVRADRQASVPGLIGGWCTGSGAASRARVRFLWCTL
ncbi:hypothetical protein BD413DRAFT_243620 [Trametes elegans]|nr:hypothetical protein BD413DRAFT_243620 [Trametes elegans]